MLTNPRISVELNGRPCQLAFDMAAAYWLERTHQLSFDKVAAAQALLKTREERLDLIRRLVQAMTQSMSQPLSDRETKRLTAEDLLELAPAIQAAINDSLNGLPLHFESRDSETAAVEKLAWDWGRALLEAVDRLRLAPREFWQLNFAEYMVMLQAAARREEREARFTAVMVANVINHCAFSLKRPVTVEKLLGRRVKREDKTFADMTEREKKDALGGLWKQVEASRKKKEGSA